MAIGRGLLQRLSSPNGRRHAQDLQQSILLNLNSILNTHEGDGFTCPDMGCDFVDLLSKWPTSEMDVIRSVQDSIQQYETRLENVRVRRINPDSARIELEISGSLKASNDPGSRLRMQTELSRTGHVQVAS